jgi:lysophospholipase L1-like esterase
VRILGGVLTTEGPVAELTPSRATTPVRLGRSQNPPLPNQQSARRQHHSVAEVPDHRAAPCGRSTRLAWLHRTMKPRDFVALMGGGAIVLFGLTWLWIATMPMAFLDPEYPAWRAKQMLLARCDLGEILILGDSRAATAMMPAGWRVRASNLAVGGGEPIEALAALDRALQCKVPPRQVILSFDAVHFAQPDLFWERTARFGFVNAEEIATLREVSHQLGDLSIYELRHTDGLPSWLRDAMYRVRFPSLYFTSLAKGGVLLRWPRNRTTLAATLAARGQYFFGTAASSDTVAADGHLPVFRPLPVLDWYFNRILQRLATHGVAAVFIAVPMNDATAREATPEVATAFRAWLAGYEARYPGFRIVGDVMPHWPDALFGDGFAHLNPAGAARFSSGLERCLDAPVLRAACVHRLQAAPPSTQNDAQ